jgi:hypothetical protein
MKKATLPFIYIPFLLVFASLASFCSNALVQEAP